MRESRSLDQVRMLGAFSRSPLSGWTFIVGVPLDVAEAGGFRALSFGLLAALGFLLLGAAIALAVARRLTGAIGRLSATAAQFRDGGDARFRPSGLAEIDEVGAALEAAFAAREASEERFALAQEVGGIGAWDWDTVRDRGHVSDAYKAMHGLSQVVGPLCLNQLLDVIHPDDLEGYSARLAAARSTPEPSTNEYRVVHADGTVRWIAAKGRPVFDENGHHVRAVGVVRDVTADREAERELRRLNEQLEARVEARTAELAESERRFRGIFDTSFQLTGLGTLDGTVLLVNQAALDAVGATQEQVRGLKMWDAPWWAATPAEAVRVREALGDAVQGRFVRYEAQLNLPGGPRTFDFSMKPLLGDGGAPTLLIAEGRDITELKQTEEALRQSQKLESMGQLTGGVAHDFNNLLTPIVGSLDMLQRRGVGGDREQRLIAGALQSAEKATMLVQRLLAFARRQPLQPTAVDLAKLVAGMTELIASTSGPRIRLTADLRPDLPPVTADPNQVEMAILNLAVNARDAMPDGGSLTIAAHAEEVGAGESASLAPGAYVRLSVSDTGTGMDEATRARAIEPFFSTKGVGKGTGLGLSMVHGLAGQLGGALTIDSRPGLGTTVALWLPVAAERPVEGGAADVAAATASVGNVLLVDDDDLARASTAEMLADLGYAVVEAVSGEDALRLADAGMTFDLLVTDHLMPGLTGAELARTVMKRRPGTPVLIISGYAEVDGIAPDLHRLSKPFRQVDLASRVAELLNAAAPQRAQPC